MIGAMLSTLIAASVSTCHDSVRSGKTSSEPSCRIPATVKPPSR